MQQCALAEERQLAAHAKYVVEWRVVPRDGPDALLRECKVEGEGGGVSKWCWWWWWCRGKEDGTARRTKDLIRIPPAVHVLSTVFLFLCRPGDDQPSGVARSLFVSFPPLPSCVCASLQLVLQPSLVPRATTPLVVRGSFVWHGPIVRGSLIRSNGRLGNVHVVRRSPTSAELLLLLLSTPGSRLPSTRPA